MIDDHINNVATDVGEVERFDDDDIKLPADTLAILNDFLQNKNHTEQLELQIDGTNSNNTFEEDWVGLEHEFCNQNRADFIFFIPWFFSN